MGKKTIKVPYSDTIPKTSMFCQDNGTLVNIYNEPIDNLWGCVIRPIDGNGYFFYRKDLGDGQMLVCGECYPCSTESEYQEAVYYLDEDHEPNTVGFIDEPSLTNDDEFEEEVIADKKKDKKMQQELQKLKSSIPVVKETRIYIVDVSKSHMIGRSTSDKDFVSEAEKQGSVYSLKGFEEAFNYDEVSTDNSLMRIIT